MLGNDATLPPAGETAVFARSLWVGAALGQDSAGPTAASAQGHALARSTTCAFPGLWTEEVPCSARTELPSQGLTSACELRDLPKWASVCRPQGNSAHEVRGSRARGVSAPGGDARRRGGRAIPSRESAPGATAGDPQMIPCGGARTWGEELGGLLAGRFICVNDGGGAQAQADTRAWAGHRILGVLHMDVCRSLGTRGTAHGREQVTGY